MDKLIGFDIKILIEKEIIKEENGVYKFIDIDKLFIYGMELINNKQFDKANNCFLKCLELNPKHIKAAFQLFVTSIRNGNFEESFKYLCVFYNDKNIQDNKLYLYLLSFIVKLPNEYKNIVNDMIYEDTELSGNKFHISQINNIRSLIFRNKFTLSLSKLNDLMANKMYVRDIIIKKLLIKIVNIEELIRNQIYDLGQLKDYESIVKLLESKSNLSIVNQYFLKLSHKYIEIEKSKEIPTVNKDYFTKDIFSAIDRNDFELALKLIKEQANDENIQSKIMHIILLDLINKTNEILKENIFINLVNGNIDKSLEWLDIYLIKINQQKYRKVIVNLIKLCLVQNDMSFIRVKKILEQIEKNELIDTKDYIIDFYRVLRNKEWNQVQLYLSIISKLDNEEIVERLMKDYEFMKKGYITNKENTSNLMTNPYYKFLYEQNKVLEQQKVIIVSDEEMVENIGRFIEYFPEMRVFKIKHNNQIQMVLKYRQARNEDFKDLMTKGKKAYDEGNYQQAIEYCELLNSLSSKNSIFCYSILGWSYYRLNNYEYALKYFIITDYLNKLEKKDFDLEKIIKNLENILKVNTRETDKILVLNRNRVVL